MVPKLLLVACSTLVGQLPPGDGGIEGVVVSASADRVPLGGAEVVLRVAMDGQFVILAETTTDAGGRFAFNPLPVGRGHVYLPGANRHGVHYPGRRIQLTWERPRAAVELQVRDAIETPSPLVALEHDIVIRPEPGALSVTETILVENPTSKCYVGRAAHEGAEPVTLRLSIPSNFERTTFHEEFLGRRFALIEGKLVTSIPWQPGQREVAFTYVLPNAKKNLVWERPLDLPCSALRVRVETARPEEVACNLQPAPAGKDGALVYESDGAILPQGHLLRVQIGDLPVGWMVYGKWLSALVLISLIAGAGLMVLRRRPPAQGEPGPPSPPSEAKSQPVAVSQGDLREAQSERKRKTSRRRAA